MDCKVSFDEFSAYYSNYETIDFRKCVTIGKTMKEVKGTTFCHKKISRILMQKMLQNRLT